METEVTDDGESRNLTFCQGKKKKKFQRYRMVSLGTHAKMNCKMKLLIADWREAHVHVSLTIPPGGAKIKKFPECAE